MSRNEHALAPTRIFAAKALTISQPWASVIAFGGKDVENRTWWTHYRGPIAIHAAKKARPQSSLDMIWRRATKKTLAELVRDGRQKYAVDRDESDFGLSQIIAIATLVDCTKKSGSRWQERGYWGWVLENVVPIEPVPMNGMLGRWTCEFRYKPLRRRRAR